MAATFEKYQGLADRSESPRFSGLPRLSRCWSLSRYTGMAEKSAESEKSVDRQISVASHNEQRSSTNEQHEEGQIVDAFVPLCCGGENIRSIPVVQSSESAYNFVSSRLCGENHFHSPVSQLPFSSPSGGYGLASYAMNSLGITNNTAQIFNSDPNLQPMSSGVFNAKLYADSED